MKRFLKLINFKDEDPKFIDVTVLQSGLNASQEELVLTFKICQKNVDLNLFLPKTIRNLKKGSELWKQTCFECFFFDENSEKYFEVNVSLDGEYDLMSFKKYREQSNQAAPIQVSDLIVKNDQKFVVVSYKLRTEFKSSHQLSPAVILSTHNYQKFFALRHSKIKPDFHKNIIL
jgi:hypothetical protein